MKHIEDIKSYLLGAIAHGNDLEAAFAGRMLRWITEDTKPIKEMYDTLYNYIETMNAIAEQIEIVDAQEPSWKVGEFWYDRDNDVVMVNFKERVDK